MYLIGTCTGDQLLYKQLETRNLTQLATEDHVQHPSVLSNPLLPLFLMWRQVHVILQVSV